jgi:translation initiation factor IF-1
MSKEKNAVILVEGVIREALPNTKFKVEIEGGAIIQGYVSGKMRMHYIKLLLGDKVTMELSPYDLTKGRIIIRHK